VVLDRRVEHHAHAPERFDAASGRRFDDNVDVIELEAWALRECLSRDQRREQNENSDPKPPA
jgi:hypothetical protein